MRFLDLPEAFIVNICEYVPRGSKTYSQLSTIHALLKTCKRFSFLREYTYLMLTCAGTFLGYPWYWAYSVNSNGLLHGPDYNWIYKEETFIVFDYRYYLQSELKYELIMKDVTSFESGFDIKLNNVTYTVNLPILVDILFKLRALHEDVYDRGLVDTCVKFTLNTMTKTWLIRKSFPWFPITVTDFTLT